MLLSSNGLKELMKVLAIPIGTLALTVVATNLCYAGPCSREVARMQVKIDAKLESAAKSGPTEGETSAAMLHHQPTPRSIATAEAKIGDLSPETLRIVVEAMDRAREADSSGDKTVCDQALDAAQREIGN